jgi:hypothetical protein
MVIPESDPSEPCLESDTVKLLREVHEHAVEGDIACDPAEIAEAHWYSRDDLTMIPPGISIARRLIDDWVFRRY